LDSAVEEARRESLLRTAGLMEDSNPVFRRLVRYI
jgi:hypothetical protein